MRLPSGQFKLRVAGGKLKVEHSIIDGLRPILERVISSHYEAINVVVPGRITAIRNNHGDAIRMRLTVPLNDSSIGWKALAFGRGAKQEIFFNTFLSKLDLTSALIESGAYVNEGEHKDDK